MMPHLMQMGGSWRRLRLFLPPGPSGLSRPLSGSGCLLSVPGCGFVGRARRLLAGSYPFFGVGATGWSLRSLAHRLGDCIYGGVPRFSTFGDSSTSFGQSLGGIWPRFHSRCRLGYGGCWGPCAILCSAHGGSRRPWGDICSFGGPPWPSGPRATFIPIWTFLRLWVALASTRAFPVWTWGASGLPSLVFLNQEWGVLVSPGGHPFCMGAILVDGRIRTKESHPPLDPIMPWVLLTLWLLLAPFTALPSPLRWQFLLFIHPVLAPPFHPRFLFRVIRGIIRLGVLLSAVIWGGALPLRLPAHMVALLAVRLRPVTPFLPRYVIGVLRVWSEMSLIGRSRRWMTFPFLRSRFLRTNFLCHPSSWVRII
jgi:hypothetical protein